MGIDDINRAAEQADARATEESKILDYNNAQEKAAARSHNIKEVFKTGIATANVIGQMRQTESVRKYEETRDQDIQKRIENLSSNYSPGDRASMIKSIMKEGKASAGYAATILSDSTLDFNVKKQLIEAHDNKLTQSMNRLYNKSVQEHVKIEKEQEKRIRSDAYSASRDRDVTNNDNILSRFNKSIKVSPLQRHAALFLRANAEARGKMDRAIEDEENAILAESSYKALESILTESDKIRYKKSIKKIKTSNGESVYKSHKKVLKKIKAASWESTVDNLIVVSQRQDLKQYHPVINGVLELFTGDNPPSVEERKDFLREAQDTMDVIDNDNTESSFDFKAVIEGIVNQGIKEQAEKKNSFNGVMGFDIQGLRDDEIDRNMTGLGGATKAGSGKNGLISLPNHTAAQTAINTISKSKQDDNYKAWLGASFYTDKLPPTLVDLLKESDLSFTMSGVQRKFSGRSPTDTLKAFGLSDKELKPLKDAQRKAYSALGYAYIGRQIVGDNTKNLSDNDRAEKIAVWEDKGLWDRSYNNHAGKEIRKAIEAGAFPDPSGSPPPAVREKTQMQYPDSGLDEVIQNQEELDEVGQIREGTSYVLSADYQRELAEHAKEPGFETVLKAFDGKIAVVKQDLVSGVSQELVSVNSLTDKVSYTKYNIGAGFDEKYHNDATVAVRKIVGTSDDVYLHAQTVVQTDPRLITSMRKLDPKATLVDAEAEMIFHVAKENDLDDDKADGAPITGMGRYGVNITHHLRRSEYYNSKTKKYTSNGKSYQKEYNSKRVQQAVDGAFLIADSIKTARTWALDQRLKSKKTADLLAAAVYNGGTTLDKTQFKALDQLMTTNKSVRADIMPKKSDGNKAQNLGYMYMSIVVKYPEYEKAFLGSTMKDDKGKVRTFEYIMGERGKLDKARILKSVNSMPANLVEALRATD